MDSRKIFSFSTPSHSSGIFAINLFQQHYVYVDFIVRKAGQVSVKISPEPSEQQVLVLSLTRDNCCIHRDRCEGPVLLEFLAMSPKHSWGSILTLRSLTGRGSGSDGTTQRRNIQRGGKYKFLLLKTKENVKFISFCFWVGNT